MNIDISTFFLSILRLINLSMFYVNIVLLISYYV